MSFRQFHKTRLAPTPSGFLHIGNVFSFALTTALAEQMGAQILLRIDDMDRERVEQQYIDDIFETLDFLGIPWHEGPRDSVDFEANFSQRHRLDLYQIALEKLVKTGLVYACDCSRKQIAEQNNGIYRGTCKHKKIPLETENVAWRINTETARMVRLNKVNFVAFPAEMQHFVIRKKDGFPAYQLTSVIDDLHYGIDLVVRGQDLFQSTLAQLFLAQLLGETRFADIYFYHHQLLTDTDARKLSKSAGDTSIHYLRQHGKTAAEIYRLIGDNAGLTIDKWEDFAPLLPNLI
jgi:glutamyl/glutaminyl-tRNA synthetase